MLNLIKGLFSKKHKIKIKIKKLLQWLLRPFVFLKWNKDKRHLQLESENYDLYLMIHVSYWMKFYTFPNLLNCNDYNLKIHWLKLFDQNPLMIQCCDKVLVRDFVKERIGEGYLPELYKVSDSYSGINFDLLPSSFVIKTNHDSGTVVIVKDKTLLDHTNVELKIKESLSKSYGWDLGEWAYSFVKPRVFAEELLGFEDPVAPPQQTISFTV